MVLHAEVIIPTHESGPGAGVRRGVTSSDIFPGGAGAAVLECWNAGLLKSHFTCQRSVSTASAPLPLHRRVALTQHSRMGTLAILDYCNACKLDHLWFCCFYFFAVFIIGRKIFNVIASLSIEVDSESHLWFCLFCPDFFKEKRHWDVIHVLS